MYFFQILGIVFLVIGALALTFCGLTLTPRTARRYGLTAAIFIILAAASFTIYHLR